MDSAMQSRSVNESFCFFFQKEALSFLKKRNKKRRFIILGDDG
jgi:hypothetical protein